MPDVKSPLLTYFDQEPALVTPDSRPLIEQALVSAAEDVARIEAVDPSDVARMTDDFWFAEEDWRSRFRPYVIKDGVLHIPVKGVLLKDFPYQDGRWATGYEYIWRAFKRGMDDSDVRAIALGIHSPGGMVAGCFELVDQMYEIRDRKPVRAFANDSAYSAAYAIASVAQSGLTVTRSGGVGSVGVITQHWNIKGMLERYGEEVTLIFAGKHKADGNPYEKLPEEVKARIQERIDALYSVFVSTVARNREMDEQAVRDTEAQTFTAQEALSNGMADAIGSFDDAVAAFAAETLNQGEEQMSNKDNSAAVDQAAVDAARTEAHASGMVDGAKAERDRINAILGCDAAASRPQAAMSAALKTDMTIEQAAAFLGDLPEESKAEAPTKAEEPVKSAGAPDGMFDAAMDKTPNPEVGADKASAQGEDPEKIDPVALARNFGIAGVRSESPKH